MVRSVSEHRRPIAARGTAWARIAAGGLARARLTPNQVSVSSIAFAAVGGGAFLLSGVSEGLTAAAWFGLAALCIALRSMANMLDGMVAVEHDRGSPEGPLFNEVPDRFSDTLLLVGAGYGSSLAFDGWALAGTLGWVAALGALFVAYTRALVGSLGLGQDYSGPMAKQQRMAVLALGAIASAVEAIALGTAWMLPASLVIIVLGCAATIANRLRRAGRALREGASHAP